MPTPTPAPTVTPPAPVPATTAGQTIQVFTKEGSDYTFDQVNLNDIFKGKNKGALIISDDAKKVLGGTQLFESLKLLGIEKTRDEIKDGTKLFPYTIVIDSLGVGPERLLLTNRLGTLLGEVGPVFHTKTKQNIYWCFIFNDMTHYNDDWHKYRNAQEGFRSGYHLMDIPRGTRIYKIFSCLIDKNAVVNDLLDFIKMAP